MSMSRLSKFYNFMTPYISRCHNLIKLGAAATIDLVSSALKIIVPIIAMDRFFNKDGSEPSEKITDDLPLLIAVSSTFVIVNFLPVARNYLLSSVRSDVQAALSEDMLRATYKMELDEHLSAPTGKFAQLLRTVYTSVEQVVPSTYGGLLPASLDILASTVALSLVNLRVGLIEIGISAAYIAASGYNSYQIGKVTEEKVKSIYAAYGNLLSAIGRYQVAHQFDNVELEIDRVKETLLSQKKAFTKNHRQEVANDFRSHLILIAGMAGILAYEMYNPITKKDLLLINYFLVIANFALPVLGDAMQKIYIASSECEKIIDFMETQKNIFEEDTIQFITNNAPSIEFQNVDFSYKPAKGQKILDPAKGQKTLDKVSFSVKPGQKVAVVGESGAGKSTLIKLLLRFYTPDSGKVLVNGQDIKSFSAESLRSEISVVSQNSTLFHGTIAENIAYGDMQADRITIEEAAKLAGLDEWLNSESGRTLDENIGADGDKLSGGEKQRIAVARALMKSGLIFLLDEATSALDVGTEKNTLDKIDILTNKNTVLVITHRLTSIVNADHIVYMEKGKVIEQGTFKELMNNQKAFYRQIDVECKKLGISINDIIPDQSRTKTSSVSSVGMFCANRRAHRLQRNISPIAHDIIVEISDDDSYIPRKKPKDKISRKTPSMFDATKLKEGVPNNSVDSGFDEEAPLILKDNFKK